MNAGTSTHRIPAKLPVRARASVTAGLAKLVDEVNQYAATIHAATSAGTLSGRWRRPRRIVSSRPKLAVASPSH